MKLYNVTVRVVDLVWAESPEEAIQTLREDLGANSRFDPMPDGNHAFVSEPIPEMGWAGER